jgi:hypothetical protein
MDKVYVGRSMVLISFTCSAAIEPFLVVMLCFLRSFKTPWLLEVISLAFFSQCIMLFLLVLLIANVHIINIA